MALNQISNAGCRLCLYGLGPSVMRTAFVFLVAVKISPRFVVPSVLFCGVTNPGISQACNLARISLVLANPWTLISSAWVTLNSKPFISILSPTRKPPITVIFNDLAINVGSLGPLGSSNGGCTGGVVVSTKWSSGVTSSGLQDVKQIKPIIANINIVLFIFSNRFKLFVLYLFAEYHIHKTFAFGIVYGS